MCFFRGLFLLTRLQHRFYLIGLFDGLLITFDKLLALCPFFIIFYGCIKLQPVAPFSLSPWLDILGANAIVGFDEEIIAYDKLHCVC